MRKEPDLKSVEINNHGRGTWKFRWRVRINGKVRRRSCTRQFINSQGALEYQLLLQKNWREIWPLSRLSSLKSSNQV
jgi:hypothetical protein